MGRNVSWLLMPVVALIGFTVTGWGADYPIPRIPVSHSESPTPGRLSLGDIIRVVVETISGKTASRESGPSSAGVGQEGDSGKHAARKPRQWHHATRGTTVEKTPFGKEVRSAANVPSPAPTTAAAPRGDVPTMLLIVASDPGGARTGYDELPIKTVEVAPTDRTHTLSVTCIGSLSNERNGFLLVTNLPEAIDLFKNGDTLVATGPRCPNIAESASESAVTLSMKKTGEIPTHLAKPRFQYVILGDVLSEMAAPSETASSTDAFRDCESCPQMLRLPGGVFSMGSRLSPTEQPVHLVKVLPFALARSPITVGQWRQCVVVTACSYEPIRDGGSDDTPVHNVSWEEAQQYVAWISQITKQNYRLPTEAEWEYATRAGTQTAYWWGGRLADRMANCRECGEPFKVDMPVTAASFAPNRWGLYGTAGGVAQWVSDCWHESYDGAPSDGSSWDTADCSEHVLRGGSWMDDAGRLRAASRHHYAGTLRYPGHGFRIARSP
jgi:formylglycine-generating enzyme required for sulfatase activity